MWWLQCICIHWLPPCSSFELSSLSCHAGNLYQDPAMLATPHYKVYADTMHMRSLTPSMLLIRTLLLPCGELDCDPAISITPHSKALDGGGVYNFLCVCVHVHLCVCVCVCETVCMHSLYPINWSCVCPTAEQQSRKTGARTLPPTYSSFTCQHQLCTHMYNLSSMS